MVAAWALASFLADRQLELPGVLRLAAVMAMLLFILKVSRTTRRRMASPPETADLAATVEAYAPALEGQLFNILQLPDEVRRLIAAADRAKWQHWPLVVRLYLMTAARKSEILRRCRKDVDLDAGTILVPITKNGEPRTMIVPPGSGKVFVSGSNAE